MKIGLFGGTFDPIHTAHIDTALAFADALSLDRVILMPTGVPPHKLKARAASAEHRLAMCRLAASEHPIFTVSDMEIRRRGASFTADTLIELDREMPNNEWYLITGADMFVTLGSWYRFDEIARRAVLCSTPRPPIGQDEMDRYAHELECRGATCLVLPLIDSAISSTDIRTRLDQGQPIDDLVPPTVAEYIADHQLYKDDEYMQNRTRDEQFIEIIRGRLTEKRFRHSLAVADEAYRLAVRYGVDPDKAKTAGILHDILKDDSPETQLQILRDFDILMSDVERQAPKLWHAMAGSVFIERVLGLKDAEIVQAVRYHTTAKAGMTALEKVLYLADFTSADRDYEDVDEMRRLVDIGMLPAMKYALQYTITDLVERGVPVHPDTLAAYNECMMTHE